MSYVSTMAMTTNPLVIVVSSGWSSFPGLVPSDDTVDSESVMGTKSGDSSVVIGFQVDEFTCTWSTEWFVAHSHIYPRFTGKMSSLTHFPLVRIISFWIRLLLTLNKAWIPSTLIHSRHQKWTLPWMSLMSLNLQSLLGFFAWLVPFLIILSSSLLLAFKLINCCARLGLFLPCVSGYQDISI